MQSLYAIIVCTHCMHSLYAVTHCDEVVPATVSMNSEHYAEWKPDMKGPTVNDPIDMKYPEKANLETESRLLVSGTGVKWKMKANAEYTSFWGNKYVLELTLVIVAKFCEHTEKIMEINTSGELCGVWIISQQNYFICIKKVVKGLVVQSCLTLCDPVDCSLPGSSVHWNSPGKNTGVGSQSLPGDLPNTGIKLWSPTLQADSLLSEPPGHIECIAYKYII